MTPRGPQGLRGRTLPGLANSHGHGTVVHGISTSMDALSQLASNSSYLLILDIPEGTEFGIDFLLCNCGPKFKGVKFIPPGVHIVYYTYVSDMLSGSSCRPTNKHGDVSVRSSFFIVLLPGQVEVRRWHSGTEELVPLDDEEAERYTLGWH